VIKVVFSTKGTHINIGQLFNNPLKYHYYGLLKGEYDG